ncbi:MAG: hypothetical protein ACOY3P_05990, partial [Planctomycetota bacterium]
MSNTRLVVTGCALLVLVGGMLDTLPAGEGAPTPPPISRFPSFVSVVRVQLDGSAVCATSEGVFLAVDDLRRWSAVPSVPRNRPFVPVGGDCSRFFGEDALGSSDLERANNAHTIVVDASSLQAVGVNGTVTTVLHSVPQRSVAAFASKDTGALAWSEDITAPHGGIESTQHNLRVTTDGGVTWKPIDLPQMENKFEAVSAMAWASPSRLLIGGSKGSVRLFEHRGNAVFIHVWSATLPEGVPEFALDGDYAWTGRRSLYRLRMSDGSLDATVAPGVIVKGLAACHGSLLVWDGGIVQPRVHHGLDGFSTVEEFWAHESRMAAKELPRIQVWARESKNGFSRRASIPAAGPAGILPLETPLCLVIAADDGAATLLDLEKCTLSPVAIQVTPLPPPPPNPNVATSDEIKATFDLSARVPMRERNAIFKEAM